jgi:hypothetical protein
MDTSSSVGGWGRACEQHESVGALPRGAPSRSVSCSRGVLASRRACERRGRLGGRQRRRLTGFDVRRRRSRHRVRDRGRLPKARSHSAEGVGTSRGVACSAGAPPSAWADGFADRSRTAVSCARDRARRTSARVFPTLACLRRCLPEWSAPVVGARYRVRSSAASGTSFAWPTARCVRWRPWATGQPGCSPADAVSSSWALEFIPNQCPSPLHLGRPGRRTRRTGRPLAEPRGPRVGARLGLLSGDKYSNG